MVLYQGTRLPRIRLGAQDDQVERALEDLDVPPLFTGYSSEKSAFPLVCQAEKRRASAF